MIASIGKLNITDLQFDSIALREHFKIASVL